MMWALRLAWLGLLGLAACDGTDAPVDTDGTDTGVATEVEASTCSGWTLISTFYPEVSLADLTACDEGQGAVVAASLMNFEGLTITGDSVVAADGSNTLAPCVEALCDAEYAYIASNALPHYAPQADPIFETVDVPIVHRIPLFPQSVDPTSVVADSWFDTLGCDLALGMAVDDETPTMPPMGHCWYETEDGSANTGSLYITDGDEAVHKVHCYGQTGSVITGVPTFAPCEEARPDPYGSPLFASYEDTTNPFVDFCGTHPAAITHNHWLNEVCLEQDTDNRPANSYVAGAEAFVIEALDAADCTEESDTLGWAYDGYPLSGTCLCMARSADGTCTDLRRARSSYVYTGITAWADDTSADPNLHSDTLADSALALEMAACTTDAECCDGADPFCPLVCHPLLVESATGGISLEDRCVTPDYSWCTHEFAGHDDVLEDAGYVYLDRCNGIETADGYRYVGTPTFPYVNACYRGEPSAMATDDTYIRLDVGDGPPGGGPPGGN